MEKNTVFCSNPRQILTGGMGSLPLSILTIKGRRKNAHPYGRKEENAAGSLSSALSLWLDFKAAEALRHNSVRAPPLKGIVPSRTVKTPTPLTP